MDGQNGEQVELGAIIPAGGLLKNLPKRDRACVACKFSAKEQRDRVCRYDPPKVFGFMLPVMVPGPRGMQQGLEFKSYTVFPVMQDDQSCGRFEARSP